MTFKNGDVVKLPNGRVVTLEDINTNPNYVEDEELWAEASSRYGSYDIEILTPEGLTLVTHAEDVVRPTEEEFAKALQSHAMFDDGRFNVDETSYEGNGYFYVLGTTNDGQNFGADIYVRNLQIGMY